MKHSAEAATQCAQARQNALRERKTAGGEVMVMLVCPHCSGIWLDKGELEKLSQPESTLPGP